MESGIYKIKHKGSGRFYVGSALCLKSRWTTHKVQLRNSEHPNRHLQVAWKLYGELAFEFSVLERCVPEELISREQHYFDILNPFGSNGYNICRVAGSTLGIKWGSHTPESIAKMRAAHTGHTHTEEAKEKCRIAGRKVAFTPDHREKLARKAKGRTFSASTRQKITVSLSGRVGSQLGAIRSQETRAKISAVQLGKKMSEQTKAKMAESQRRRWELRRQQVA